MKPKRILHIVGQMDRGGQESLIMNLYRNKIQFDFVVHTSQKCDFDDEIIFVEENNRFLYSYFFFLKRWKIRCMFHTNFFFSVNS